MYGLDGPEALAADSLGLIAGMADSVAAFDESRAASEAVELPFPPEAVGDIAVCGMGGSGIAGNLVLGAYRDRLLRPMTVVRDYYLPGWIGENTLVILSSYSGDTEETLTCASQALERNALCVAVTSGGKLARFYAAEGVPVIPLPPGLQPRAALIRLLVPVAVLLDRVGAVPPLGPDLQEARETIAASVAALGPEVPESGNPAKQLARALLGSVPLIWGAELTAAVAYRWRCQIEENAKLPASSAELPELDHNDIVGLSGTPAPLSELTQLLLLRDPRNHRQVERRFDLTREIVEPHVDSSLSITAEGQAPLARMLDLVMLGDYASLYLALLRGVDPGPVEPIERLKARLAETGYGRAAGAEG
ncbi:MAG TPA: bifunctional phosphoglucose/phosphomannose isomerase [Miltoncostaeaceae bacterium]|nr:bifunctional phosphoglucose/phosphomannose isomerase [Miltoncostaeaceae bacterium]